MAETEKEVVPVDRQLVADAVPDVTMGPAMEPSAPAALVGESGPTLQTSAIPEAQNEKIGQRKTSSEGTGDDKAIEVDPFAHLKESEREIVRAQAEVPATRKIGFFELFKYSSGPELAINAVGLFCAIAAGAAQPLMTLVFGNLTTSFTSFQTARNNGVSTTDVANQLFSQVQTDALYLVGIGAGMTVFTWLYSAIWTITGERTTKRIREAYLRAVLFSNVAYFDQLGSGEVATRIESDCHLIQEGISDKVPIIVQFISTFVTGFIIAYVKSWRLALVLSSIIPALILVGGIFNKFIAKGKQEQLRLAANGGTLVEEVLSTIRTTYSYGLQERLAQVYDQKANIQIEQVGFKMARLQALSFCGFFFIVYNGYALAIFWATSLLLDGDIVPGDAITAFFAILFGAFSLVQIAPMLQAIGFATGAGGKLFDTIERKPPIDSSSPDGLKPEKLHAEITLQGVNFVYPSRPSVQVLYDFAATFRQGETTALVGGSGSGKSTIVALLERFYDPMAGSIKIDGIDIKDFNLKWLRSQIGYVEQSATLFQCSIAENVAHGLIGTPHEHAPWEQKFKMVQEACQKANADEFIRMLPQSYETNIGERGMLLSGGQRQRICIARAIVADPPILLLDEATSALDTKSERVVQAALDVAAKGRTTLSIAHRLSTIRNADQIIVMQFGKIMEVGSYSELVAHEDGPFARLVNAQKFREMAENEESEKVVDDENELGEKAESGQLVRHQSSAPVGSLKRNQSGASSLQMAEKRGHDFDAAVQEVDIGATKLFWRIFKFNSENWRYYVLGVGSACLTGMAYPVFAIIFGSAIGIFSESGEALRDGGNRRALYLFILALISSASIGVQNYTWFKSSELLGRKLRLQVYRDIMRQDVAYFDREENSSGSLTSNVSDHAVKINGLFGVTFGTIFQSLVTLVGGVTVGLCYADKVAAVGLAVIPFTFTAGLVRLRVVILKDRRSKASHAKSAQMACEAAAAIRTVASLTREEDVLRIYAELLEKPYRDAFVTAIYSNLIYGFSQSAAFFGMALLFWYGSHQLVDAGLTTGHFFTALMAVLFGSIQAGNIFSFVPDFSQAVGAARAVITLLDSTPEIVADEGASVDKIEGELLFSNVHYRYATRPNVPVLRGLSLKIKKNSYVALVGPSGCGKSTIIQLIERFYDPMSGEIHLDGRKLSELKVEDFRRGYGLVSQEVSLYTGTVRENVLWGSATPDSVTQEQIEKACADANILDFVKSLPDGFDTEVGGKGAQLSGGQKQRVALARAMIRHPKILLLDEATSALDSESERVVQRALDDAAKGRTTVAVAHRLSTIQQADLILVLLGGKVFEYGRHADLMKKKGMYFELVAQQTLDK